MPNKLATDFRTKTPDELQTQLDELSKNSLTFVSKKQTASWKIQHVLGK